jgi:N-acetylglutamate synthase-like GNAT family acetyltransferase
MNLTITIPDEILQTANLTVAKVKQEIAGLFWQKRYMTLEQASRFAEIRDRAVEQSMQGQGLGEELLKNALHRCVNLSNPLTPS